MNIYLMTDWQEVKKIMQSLTTVADPVWNSFISERVTLNSTGRLSRTSTGQASTSYNNTGRHLFRMR